MRLIRPAGIAGFSDALSYHCSFARLDCETATFEMRECSPSATVRQIGEFA